MSLFHESIKQILAEVEKFLTETLKNEKKLSKQTGEHKQLILEKLNNFFNENPSMKLRQDTLSVDTGADESSLTGGSSNTEEGEDNAYIDHGVAEIAAADLTDPVCSGYLEKKQKKDFLSAKLGLFGAKFQKRWCVIKNGVMYYYAKPEEKKQNGSFKLEGYSFRPAPELSSKSKEKELQFEVAAEGDKRVYQFIAPNKEEFEKWHEAIRAGGFLIEEDFYEEVEARTEEPKREEPAPVQDEEYEDATVKEAPAQDEVYEDPDAQPPTPPRPNKALHPAPVRAADSQPSPVPPPVPSSAPRRVPPTPKEPVEEPLIEEDVYDDAESVSTALTPAPTAEQPPAVPPPRRGAPHIPLPQVPPPKKKIKISITCNPETDFENRYYGKWDCNADNRQELAFKKGDIIYIVSKEFDDKSWWIGELGGKFGLVPKTYLIPAFEKAV